MALAQVLHRTVEIDGCKTFYREAGAKGAPAVLLLHGYSDSSSEYQQLLPALADHWHVIAPDLPGFGRSTAPKNFHYTFDGYADFLNSFVKTLGLSRFSVYLQSLSLHIGFRLAMKDPNRIIGLIMQNADVYQPQPVFIKAAQGMLTQQHAPEQRQIIESFIKDLKKNGNLFEECQAYLRDNQPPVLLLASSQEGIMPQTTLEAYSRDLPHAEINVLEAGQQLLDTNFHEVVPLVRSFLDRVA